MPRLPDVLQRYVYRFDWVTRGEVARCSQWYVDWKQDDLLAEGIKSIVNLRGRNPKRWWWRREDRFAQENGIARFDVTMSSRQLPTRKMMLVLVDALERAPHPMLLKCAGGQDRTGLSAALYLIQRDGWQARATAMKEFHVWPGPKARKVQQWLQIFFDYAFEQANGRSIVQWIRDEYEPVPFRDWLNANGHAGTFERIHKEI